MNGFQSRWKNLNCNALDEIVFLKNQGHCIGSAIFKDFCGMLHCLLSFIGKSTFSALLTSESDAGEATNLGGGGRGGTKQLLFPTTPGLTLKVM